ncbi:hypothetical protein LY78DRAFT_650081 [Colletotrichum sublineola]|nr:hypothetical protein LY78DRAFT_650081 [Colletotrichum sublineola]
MGAISVPFSYVCSPMFSSLVQVWALTKLKAEPHPYFPKWLRSPSGQPGVAGKRRVVTPSKAVVIHGLKTQRLNLSESPDPLQHSLVRRELDI